MPQPLSQAAQAWTQAVPGLHVVAASLIALDAQQNQYWRA